MASFLTFLPPPPSPEVCGYGRWDRDSEQVWGVALTLGRKPLMVGAEQGEAGHWRPGFPHR